jgi:SAM-dependent methyltransferase
MELSSSVRIEVCPVCGSAAVSPVFSAKDHTVSGLSFEIWQCNDCTLRFTQGIPGQEEMPAFYQSEAYVSHSDTSKGWINRLYHLVRTWTLSSKRKLVSSVTGTRGGRLLDIGAGSGAFVAHMMRHGWQVEGLEPDPTARKTAAGLHALELDPVEKLFDLPAQSFDVITLWHVMEHVKDLHAYLERMKSVLRPGGSILIAVPNYTSLDASIYGRFWAAYDVPRHLYHFSPASISRLFEIHGLKLKGKHPMWFDSFYISLLSEKYRTGSSNPLRGFFTGARSNCRAFVSKDRCSSLVYVAGI